MVGPLLVCGQLQEPPQIIDAVTFDAAPNVLWVRVRDLGPTGLALPRDPSKERVIEGRVIVPLSTLRGSSCGVAWDPVLKQAEIALGGSRFVARAGSKSVLVSILDQQLCAYQGSVLVLSTHVSTGRVDGSTPTGEWLAKGKERMHLSRLYDNSPMPFSVHVTKNVLLHGYHDVPQFPASHGCVRLPIPAAERLFDWIAIGTRVRIQREKLATNPEP